MNEWRRHARFECEDTEGVLRVLRDVVVRRMKNGDLVATGTEPGQVGEEVMVHVTGQKGGDVRARVVDSRLVLVEGFIRHRIRLATVDRTGAAVDDADRRGVPEAE
jgi:hypothetical protein